MSEPFVGEIRMFAGDFAPRNWALCDGGLLAVSQNDALFSLLGTIYGGDGRTTFGLPDMRGRIPIHQGTGPGLSPRQLGSKAGAENATISLQQLPSHSHAAQGLNGAGNSSDPSGNIWAGAADGTTPTYTNQAPTAGVSFNTAGTPPAISEFTGGGQSHTNLMPFLNLNFIIALFGIFPSQT